MRKWINLITESLVGQPSDILTRTPSGDAMQAFHEQQDVLLDALVSDYRSGQYEQAPWRVVPAATLRAIWQSSSRAGFVRNERGLDRIAQQFYRNVCQLYLNNRLAEHESESTRDVVEQYLDDEQLSEENLEEFVSWAVDCETGWRISDYGIKRLIELACLLHDCHDADEKLQVCDAILNVTHPRSDLASWFVEGGSHTMDGLFEA